MDANFLCSSDTLLAKILLSRHSPEEDAAGGSRAEVETRLPDAWNRHCGAFLEICDANERGAVLTRDGLRCGWDRYERANHCWREFEFTLDQLDCFTISGSVWIREGDSQDLVWAKVNRQPRKSLITVATEI